MKEGASLEITEVRVNDARSLDDILASISGDHSHTEIIEALKSVAKTQPAGSIGAAPAAPSASGEQFICPMCEGAVNAAATSCPSCGAQFEEGESAEFECPVCKVSVSPDAVRCPSCGVLFAEDEEAPTAPSAQAPATPSVPVPPPVPSAPKIGVGIPERLAAIQRTRREAPIPTPSGDRKLMYRELPKYVNDVRGLLVNAKRLGLEIDREKRAINDAIVAGKQRDVERALRSIAEAKHALDIALTVDLSRRIETFLSEVARAGPTQDASSLESALREAVNRIDARNYEGAADQVEVATKGFRAQARDYVEAKDALDQDDRLLSDAKLLGLDVREVERFLRTGREAMARRDRATALKAAEEARDRLAKALPSFVEEEMKRARNVLLDLKVRGGDLTKPIGILKAASVHAKKEDWGAAVRYLREFRREIDAQ
ncbi:MAG: zinc ribbon domain-containing protein [Methanobacteriota archaeon]